MIRVEDLTYRYPGTHEPALRKVNLDIPEGQFCAIVGPNEAGKSSLCYALTGYIPHFYHGELEGEVNIAGHQVSKTPLADLVVDIGLVLQNPFNQITGARFTVREEIAFGLENLGVPRDKILERTQEALSLTGLESLADRSPFRLSGGQQQRLAIASVMVMEPKVLVLDEPTSQLDPAGTKEFFQTMRDLTADKGTTIVLAEHKIEWIGTFADRVILISRGKIVADGIPREVLASSLIEEVGVSQSRYTIAARLARARGLISREGTLPVTLEQAIEDFL